MRYVAPWWRAVLRRIEAQGWPYGREQSFKLVRGRLLADRMLVGVPRRAVAAADLEAMAGELGMPPGAWKLLAERLPQANAVFFGTEEAPGACILKIYLEFWDEVRQAVRRGRREPQLLHLGVKWSTSRIGHWEEASYMCHPLLSVRDILRRMAACHPQGGGPAALEAARSILLRAAHRKPDAAFLYLEAREAGNPRLSYDINLYKAGLHIADVTEELQAFASHLRVAESELAGQIQESGALPLGHISGGSDRHGSEFLSVYGEIAPLPED